MGSRTRTGSDLADIPLHRMDTLDYIVILAGALDYMGGEGEAVEVDETFIGRKKGTEIRRGTTHKMAALSLVQRGGSVRSFTVNGTSAKEIGPIINANVKRETFLLSDEAKQYQAIGKGYQAHRWVNHSSCEYVDGPVHTNTIEGFFSIFKRGMKGVYQHCSEKAPSPLSGGVRFSLQ